MEQQRQAELHRYELMEDRRSGQERRRDPTRGGRDRRRVAAVVDAAPVRRIFPIIDPVDASLTSVRQRAKRFGVTVADAGAVVGALALGTALFGARVDLLGAVAAAVVLFALVRLVGLHDRDARVLHRSTLDELPALLQLAGATAAFYWLVFGEDLHRWSLPVLWLCLAGALAAARVTARRAVRAALPPERCLFIGDMAVVDTVRSKIEDGRAGGHIVVGLDLRRHSTVEAIGGIEGLKRVIAENCIDRVVLAPPSTDAASTLELIRVVKQTGAQISVFPRLFEVVGSAVDFEDLEGLTLMGVRRFGLSRGARAVKRAFDIVGASIALLLASPLLAVVAVAIKLDSRGPLLFRQRRIGRDGKWFCMLKFRTMVPGAEAMKAQLKDVGDVGGLFKLADDPRVTRVGRMLRKTSLDELPQLINVLRGEMSLVGPRPLIPDEDAQISGLDRSRLHLTPGMTGPWQVMRSGRVPINEMVTIDYLYVVNWSLWTDLKLLIRTVAYVVSRGGL